MRAATGPDQTVSRRMWPQEGALVSCLCASKGSAADQSRMRQLRLPLRQERKMRRV